MSSVAPVTRRTRCVALVAAQADLGLEIERLSREDGIGLMPRHLRVYHIIAAAGVYWSDPEMAF